MMAEYLLLKWGNLKGWKLETEASTDAFQAYVEAGENAAAPMAMVRLDGAEKQALCRLIAAVDGPITNDWSGEEMTKDEATKYVLEYS
jgi:hypothetical protein